jgi:hypothetical protein
VSGAASVVHAAARNGDRRGSGVTERRDEGSGCGERGEVRRRVRRTGVYVLVGALGSRTSYSE